MIGLDLGAFPPEIAKLVLLRGGGLPAVTWSTEGHPAAKKLLDGLDDNSLFGVASIADEQMGAAVRALLYLWTGWLGDAAMFSQAAATPERRYLSAICERHNRRFAEAKVFLKQLETHPVYPDLVEYALAATSSAADPCVLRLREMLELDRRWEPFLFCDAIAQACGGKMKPSGESIVRQLQCREFELLLVHCCEKAVGSKLNQRKLVPSGDRERQAREREKRLREERRRRDEKRKRDDSQAVCASTPSPTSNASVANGHPSQCNINVAGRASSGLSRPTGRAPASSSGSGGVIAILCPKCGSRLAVPASARGKKANCHRCGVSFLVPHAQAGA
jgi:hypothetical protein